MRIIKWGVLRDFIRKHPAAESGLCRWYEVATKARWTSLQEIRKTFPHADAVEVRSGNTVIVFNIGGGKFRLVSAVHYNTQRIYTLFVMTHQEYETQRWRQIL